ncbi:MAG: crotonase/enoyl-CoA hydratase family protein [Myxococcota bacterium]|nr:crotonase/enoyl-CoA hydratase family protein [Myxococcota bacterium]
MEFQNIKIEKNQEIAIATLDRPEKANALSQNLWNEIGELARWVDRQPDIRVVLLEGAGKHFCAGIDYQLIMEIVGKVGPKLEGHKQAALLQIIEDLQRAFTAIEQCRQPFIAAIHGACVGGGIDLVTACDIRYASAESRFSVKEIDLAIVADIGTLQRLPHLVGQGNARELAMTGRTIDAHEAKSMGLISEVFSDPQSLRDEAIKRATLISKKSPLTLRGIKKVMNYCRNVSVEQGLQYVATWNAGMLLSADAQEALSSQLEKRESVFQNPI